jgi:translation initiation factor 2B subunit (eIF-2B alpha/beta/delta family)
MSKTKRNIKRNKKNKITNKLRSNKNKTVSKNKRNISCENIGSVKEFISSINNATRKVRLENEKRANSKRR